MKHDTCTRGYGGVPGWSYRKWQGMLAAREQMGLPYGWCNGFMPWCDYAC